MRDFVEVEGGGSFFLLEVDVGRWASSVGIVFFSLGFGVWVFLEGWLDFF